MRPRALFLSCRKPGKSRIFKAKSDRFEEIQLVVILRSDVQGRTARWIASTFVLTGAVWIAAFAGLLIVASHIHVDIPYVLAVKLPLLQSRPDLIFAGESRTEYQVSAELAGK